MTIRSPSTAVSSLGLGFYPLRFLGEKSFAFAPSLTPLEAENYKQDRFVRQYLKGTERSCEIEAIVPWFKVLSLSPNHELEMEARTDARFHSTT